MEIDLQRIKRFGKQIVDSQYLGIDGWKFLDENVGKYMARLRIFEENKTVYVVEEQKSRHGWYEYYLCNWFIDHFKELGFDEICSEHTEAYDSLKDKLGFFGFPDFLALKDGKWLRVEVEVFSSSFHYNHKPDYCDVILCYDNPSGDFPEEMEIISLRELNDCKEIIAFFEIPEFLHVYDTEFREEYKKWVERYVNKWWKEFGNRRFQVK